MLSFVGMPVSLCHQQQWKLKNFWACLEFQYGVHHHDAYWKNFKKANFNSWKRLFLFEWRNVTDLTFPMRVKTTSNPRLKCQSEMAVKMRIIVASSNSSTDTTCRWRTNRPVTSLRPPPGGAIAATNNYNAITMTYSRDCGAVVILVVMME